MNNDDIVDILNDATDEEVDQALKTLNPSGKTAKEEVEEAMAIFIKMGIMPAREDE